MTNPMQEEPDGFVSLAREAVGILAHHGGTHVHSHSLVA